MRVRLKTIGKIELEKLEKPIEIDDFVEEYMTNIQNNLDEVKNVFRANKKITSNNTCKNVTLNPKNPISEVIKMTSISDLKCIYNFY